MLKELKLAPINPFTPRQREIIKLKLDGFSNEEMSKKLGISAQAIKRHITGGKAYSNISQMASETSKANLGIIGIIERAKGSRPPPQNWLPTLFSDVILEVDSPGTPKLRRESSSDEFIGFLHQTFNQQGFDIFRRQNQQDASFEEIHSFLKSSLVDKNLRKQWKFESPLRWKNRSVETALIETLFHTRAFLFGWTEVYHKNGQGEFANLSAEAVYQIGKKTEILFQYFEKRFADAREKWVAEL